MEPSRDPAQAGDSGVDPWEGIMKVHLIGSLLCAGLLIVATSSVYAAEDTKKAAPVDPQRQGRGVAAGRGGGAFEKAGGGSGGSTTTTSGDRMGGGGGKGAPIK